MTMKTIQEFWNQPGNFIECEICIIMDDPEKYTKLKKE